MISKCIAVGLMFGYVLLAGCAGKHQGEQEPSSFVSLASFSGRLLVLNPKHRWQFEIDWQGDELQGDLRITHASSGRIVYVKWLNERMLLLDSSQSPVWQPLSKATLLEMGVMLPPWMLSQVFSGRLPESMQYKGKGTWQGDWDGAYLRIRWSHERQKVELMDIKRGRKVVLLFDEVRQ